MIQFNSVHDMLCTLPAYLHGFYVAPLCRRPLNEEIMNGYDEIQVLTLVA